MLNSKECSMSYYNNVFKVIKQKFEPKLHVLWKNLSYTKTEVLRGYYAGNVLYKIVFCQLLIPEYFVWISIPL